MKLHFEVYDGYVNSMLRQNLIDFDDLLFYAYQIINLDETKKLYRRLFGHLYVDEAQDLNPTQYAIIKSISELVEDVMLIGDPSQSLYGFMGSSRTFMLTKFKNDFNAEVITLNENYRSARKIVDLVNKLNNENKSLSQFPIEGEVTFNLYENEVCEAKAIVHRIRQLQENDVKLEEIAVLGRNIYLHTEIKNEFEEENIEYNIGSVGKIVLETCDGKIFLNTIKLLDNPKNEIIINFFKELLVKNDLSADEVKTHLQLHNALLFNSAKKVYKNVNLFDQEIKSLIKY